MIPTYNSERTIAHSILSVKRQTYDNIEVIVVDSYSKDRTVEIAKALGARVVRTKGALLWARYIGHLHTRGEYELLLDSDQILVRDAIERAVGEAKKGYDMLIMEEYSYRPRTLLQWLIYLDKRHVHRIRDLHPLHGVLLARFYRRDLLDKAFKSIKQRLPLRTMFTHVPLDHALIYYEAYRCGGRPGFLPDAIYHMESPTLGAFIRKAYRFGRLELDLARYYPELGLGKKTPRKIYPHPDSLASITLWIIKAIPYSIGRLVNKLSEKPG